jgi:hypothetical protein
VAKTIQLFGNLDPKELLDVGKSAAFLGKRLHAKDR